MAMIRVEAPASSANLGPGFDALALALEKPKDTVTLKLGESSRAPSVRVSKTTGLRVPVSAVENGASVVCLEMAKAMGVKKEIIFELDKRVPIGLGMGSSGASAAAAAVAMDELLEMGLTKDELIFYAGKGEAVTSGSAHYDNVAASVLGGFVVVKGGEKPKAVRFDPPARLGLCVATPIVKLPPRKTEYARSLIPEKVPLGAAVENISNATLMVAGIAKGDIGLIGKGMVDKIVEPARKVMIPGYDQVRSRALKAGAEGVCISGAGPSMLAVVDKKKVDPRRVLEAMRGGFKEGGVESNGYVTKVGEGARVVKGS